VKAIFEVKRLPSIGELNTYFRYCDKTGNLYWKISPCSKKPNKAGSLVGCIDDGGYLIATLKGTQYKAHRLVYKIVLKKEPPLIIDHINGNKMDNRIENLRSGENKVNNRNRADSNLVHEDGYFVVFHKLTQKYALLFNKTHIGLFLSKEDAMKEVNNKPKCKEDYYRKWDGKEGINWHKKYGKWQVCIPKRFRRDNLIYLHKHDDFQSATDEMNEYIKGAV
jgi:hypothetical protein